jgi:hypothetical protein
VTIGQWVLACLWVAGIMTLVMLALLVVAIADPARRRRRSRPAAARPPSVRP